MRVLCVLAQRNEVACLEPWVRYHAYMVGRENIHIIDNASDIPYVVDKIAEYEALGIGVTHIPPGTDLAVRGQYTSEVIQRRESARHFDFVFPMDCDEFLCVWDREGQPSCNRAFVMDYLHSLRLREGVYQIWGGLENINKVAGLFVKRPHYKKVFFTAKQCLGLDLGFHRGFPKNDLPVQECDVFYLHMQVRPYHMFRHLARQKLEPFVDLDDANAVRNHQGANHHLVELFLKTEEEYDRALEELRRTQGLPEEKFDDFSRQLQILNIHPFFLQSTYYRV
jgi:hypothetical protein